MIASLVGLTLLCGSLPVAVPADRPNIVLIVADDLGYGDLGCYGARDIRTPAIDRLAASGVRLTNFYSNGPECSPTRTALMTGCYQQRAGGLECAIGTGNVGRYDDAIRLRETHDLGLPGDENMLVQRLADRGYTTVCFGKWHLGYEPKFFPREHGFKTSFGPLGGGVDYFHHTEWDGTPVLYRDGERVDEPGYLTDLITAEAVGFLERHQEGPFFLYVPYTAPHTPYQGPDDRRDKPILEDGWNDGDRATYARMVQRLDDGVGAIMKALEQRGDAEDALVIFISDNGPTKIGSAGPFSGLKSSLYEGGIHVPGMVRWPKRVPAGQVSDEVTLGMDMTASILRIAGATSRPDRPLDGVDVIAAMEKGRPLAKRPVFWRHRRGERTWRAVRDGDLKYLSRQDGDQRVEFVFDLANDPAEERNLLTDRSEAAARLKGLLAAWEKRVRPRR